MDNAQGMNYCCIVNEAVICGTFALVDTKLERWQPNIHSVTH